MRHYTEEELQKFLNREVSRIEREAIMRHLEDCDSCRETARRIHGLEGILREYYKDIEKACPQSESLVSYALGVLNEVEMSRLASHVKGCPLCTVAVRRIKLSLEEKPTPDAEIIYTISQNPDLIEKECKAFVKEKLPHEAKWTDTIWESLKSVFEKLGDTGIENWFVSGERELATSLGIVGKQSGEISSAAVMLTIWATYRQISIMQHVDRDSVDQIIEKTAKKLNLPESTKAEIRSYILELLQN